MTKSISTMTLVGLALMMCAWGIPTPNDIAITASGTESQNNAPIASKITSQVVESAPQQGQEQGGWNDLSSVAPDRAPPGVGDVVGKEGVKENSQEKSHDDTTSKVQSQANMEKSTDPKIFIYDDMPSYFNQEWYQKPHTNREMVEFESTMENMIRKSKYFTTNAGSATHFYVPVYPVSYCAAIKEEKGIWGCRNSRGFLAGSIKWIKEHHKDRWEPTHGANHLFAIGYDWGATFATFEGDSKEWGRVPELEQARVISHIGPTAASANHFAVNEGDIILPPYVSKEKRDKLKAHANSVKEKTISVYFRGTLNGPTRAPLMTAFDDFPHSVVTSSHVSQEQYTADMASSRFCLAPGGFAPWSFRHSEAILAGCYPVIPDQDHVVMPCSHFVDHTSFSVMTRGTETWRVRQAIRRADNNFGDFQSHAEHGIQEARRYYDYGSHTMECLVHQLKWNF